MSECPGMEDEEPERLFRLLLLRWYILHTHACEEERAVDHLEKREIEYLYPWLPLEPLRPGQRNPFLLARLRKFEDQEKTPRKPAFPRYVLIGLRDDQTLYRVEEMPGASTLIYGSSGPLQVPRSLMLKMLQWCEPGGRYNPPDLKLEEFRENPWRVHDRVVTPAGLPGIVEAVDDPEKTRILVEIFGRHVPIVLDANKLAEAAPSRTGRVKPAFARVRSAR